MLNARACILFLGLFQPVECCEIHAVRRREGNMLSFGSRKTLSLLVRNPRVFSVIKARARVCVLVCVTRSDEYLNTFEGSYRVASLRCR